MCILHRYEDKMGGLLRRVPKKSARVAGQHPPSCPHTYPGFAVVSSYFA